MAKLPPPVGDFFSNLLLCRFTEICMQKSPLFGDFFSNLPLCRFTEICMQKSPLFGDFFSNLPLCRFTDICMLKPTTTHTHTQCGDYFSNLALCRFTEICMQKSSPSVKGIVENSAIVISTRHWEQDISFALGNFNLFQQTREIILSINDNIYLPLETVYIYLNGEIYRNIP